MQKRKCGLPQGREVYPCPFAGSLQLKLHFPLDQILSDVVPSVRTVRGAWNPKSKGASTAPLFVILQNGSCNGRCCFGESRCLLWNRYLDSSSLVYWDFLLVALSCKSRGLRIMGAGSSRSFVLHLYVSFVLHLCVESHMKQPRAGLPRNSNQVWGVR